MDKLVADKLDAPMADGVGVEVDRPVGLDAQPVVGFAPRRALEPDLPRLAVDFDPFGADSAHPPQLHSYY